MLTAVVVQAGENGIASKIELDSQLKSYQTLVGGLIQVVEAGDIVFLMNEEAKLVGLPVNVVATAYLYEVAPEWAGWDYLSGTVLIIGNGSDDFRPVPQRVIVDFQLND